MPKNSIYPTDHHHLTFTAYTDLCGVSEESLYAYLCVRTTEYTRQYCTWIPDSELKVKTVYCASPPPLLHIIYLHKPAGHVWEQHGLA